MRAAARAVTPEARARRQLLAEMFSRKAQQCRPEQVSQYVQA
jgi:hypothetical protein